MRLEPRDSPLTFDAPARHAPVVAPLRLDRGFSSPAEVSVVVPTFNEAANIEGVVAAVRLALRDFAWEIIFVDDNSPDGTSARVQALYQADARVRCVRRIGRRGLSSACIEGMLASSARFVAVMDADLQHDPALLPRMLRLLREDQADVVVGSRYVEGGGLGAWTAERARISRFATRLTRMLTPAPLSDPMSGFFALRRDALDKAAPSLSGLGFKILLDLVLSAPGLRVKELPYVFRTRRFGQSKLTAGVAWEFGLLLLDKTVGRVLPARFFAFACIGAVGVCVHFAVLSALMSLRADFVPAQTAATLTAMVANYSINNTLTYADRSNRGRRWFMGLAWFMAICSFGALANIGVADLLVRQHADWPLAALAGICVSAVWNFAVSDRYAWKRPA